MPEESSAGDVAYEKFWTEFRRAAEENDQERAARAWRGYELGLQRGQALMKGARERMAMKENQDIFGPFPPTRHGQRVGLPPYHEMAEKAVRDGADPEYVGMLMAHIEAPITGGLLKEKSADIRKQVDAIQELKRLSRVTQIIETKYPCSASLIELRNWLKTQIEDEKKANQDYGQASDKLNEIRPGPPYDTGLYDATKTLSFIAGQEWLHHELLTQIVDYITEKCDLARPGRVISEGYEPPRWGGKVDRKG
jgi:hypothetical protein